MHNRPNRNGLDPGFCAFRRAVAWVRVQDPSLTSFATFEAGCVWMIGRAVPRLAPPANENR
jgi:hypothetical protein